MHELSIASSIVELASKSAVNAGASRVIEVRIRLGALSGVVRGALEFCYEIAVADTMLEGSKLVVRELPIRIYCPVCCDEQQLDGVQSFCCPACGAPSGDIRQGRELEIEAIEVDVPERCVA